MRRYHLLLALWFVSDILLFVGAYALAYFLRVGPIFSTNYPIEQHLSVAALTAPLWLIVLLTTRTFALNRTQHSVRNLAYITYAAAFGAALFALSYYFLYGLFFSRLLIVYAFGMTTILTYAWHIAYEHIKRRMLRSDPPTFPTIIVGITRESKRFIELLNTTHHPLKPVAVLDARGSKESDIDGVPVRGKLNKLDDVLDEGATHLIQCCNLEQTINLIQICKKRGIVYSLLPSVLGAVDGDEYVDEVQGKTLTMVHPNKSRWNWFLR